MDLEELAHLVTDMRAAQRNYFRTKDVKYINQSKTLERQVDRAVADILNPPPPGLFDQSRSERVKITLVGESNPYGADPYYALYPAPDGCAGHRLCTLVLGMHRRAYLDTFERVNLCDGKWSMPSARKRAQELWVKPVKYILFGSKVARAWEVDPWEPFTVIDGGTTLLLPHPSGLCRLWNEPGAFERARAAVAAFAPEIAHLLGVSECAT